MFIQDTNIFSKCKDVSGHISPQLQTFESKRMYKPESQLLTKECIVVTALPSQTISQPSTTETAL